MWKIIWNKKSYTTTFVLMLFLFIIYPIWIEENIIFDLLSSKLSYKSEILYELMKYVPLGYITIIGILISWINTFIYCFVDTEKKDYTNIIIYSIILVLIVIIIITSYVDFSNIIKDSSDVKKIPILYERLSYEGVIVTILTFGFFTFLDIKELFVNKKYRKTFSGGSYDEKKGHLDWKYSFLQLSLIDFPIWVGIVCIFCFTNVDTSLFPNNKDSQDFLNMFTAGAWGMQLIYSQVVFYVLTILYFYEHENSRYNKRN